MLWLFCEAMLGCALNGDELPSHVICQGKNSANGSIAHELCDPVVNGHHKGMDCGVQDRVWMDENEMAKWVNKI